MPNWVDNLMTLRGNSHSLDEIMANTKTSDEKVFDFETILPTPAIVKQSPHYNDIDHSHSLLDNKNISRLMWVCAALYDKPEEYYDQFLSYAKGHISEISDADLKNEFNRLIGANRRYWYSHNNKQWHTKWGACNPDVKRVSENELRYMFDTAWDTPKPVAAKLAEFFPDVDIVHSFSEEIDQIVGTDVYKGGKLIDSVEQGSYYVDPNDADPDTVQEL